MAYGILFTSIPFFGTLVHLPLMAFLSMLFNLIGPWCVQQKGLNSNERMILALNGWMLTKKGKLIVKSFLFFEAGKNGCFLYKSYLEPNDLD